MGHWAKVENYTNNVGTVTEIVHVTDDADVSGGKLSGSPSDDQSTVIAAQDGRQRKNCPGVGYKYNRTSDMFYEAQPYASWTLNTSTGLWEAPITLPTDQDNAYYWDESAYQADNTVGWTTVNPDG